MSKHTTNHGFPVQRRMCDTCGYRPESRFVVVKEWE